MTFLMCLTTLAVWLKVMPFFAPAVAVGVLKVPASGSRM